MMSGDVEMQDAGAPSTYAALILDEDLDAKYPNRPRNHAATLPFHSLMVDLFNPLNAARRKPAGPTLSRRQQGPHGMKNLSPHEARRQIIERFFSKWKKDVGNDIFPAFRLIVPEKDRERPMYGLKEKALAELVIRVIKIDKNSEDGNALLNYKIPGKNSKASMVGDFAGRCYEVLSKRPLRTEYGDMSMDNVNDKLDLLSTSREKQDQQAIMDEFYRRMNPEELMWLIRIILREMKIGATERTFFDIWHPDAETLFNISSNLRRVCWELYDPNVRLRSEEQNISLMQCFQPQLAQFQMHSFERMVSKMKLTEENKVFWVEEKLDGERMQLHMVQDESQPGGIRFGFWSRKGKDYTYLYGQSLRDDNSAITRHLGTAFHEKVMNIILDGEMITWDSERDVVGRFGTLKTAAIAQQRNPHAEGERPVFRVFDCLYLNDQPLTSWTLRDRRNALESAVKGAPGRLELHKYHEASDAKEITPLLRTIIAEASEGLVLKNPASAYRLNERNDDWIKVKPDYMEGGGEAFDCIVIGAYYGSGRMAGSHSSFLCGLRLDRDPGSSDEEEMKCYSFFKAGGSIPRDEFKIIEHHTEGKWKTWNRQNPPKQYIELAGGDRQFERPDEWIKPSESIVVSVKASEITPSDQFRLRLTLRFPRITRIRPDKSPQQALSVKELIDLKNNIEEEKKEKDFEVDQGRKKRARVDRKKELRVLGDAPENEVPRFATGSTTNVFTGLNFCVMSGTDPTLGPERTKDEIEAFVKHHGGAVFQTHSASTANGPIIPVADRNVVKVASLVKQNIKSIIRPRWLYDTVRQAEHDILLGRAPLLLPYEPRQMFFVQAKEDGEMIGHNADEWFDSYARDVFSNDEMRLLLDEMPLKVEKGADVDGFITELQERSDDFTTLPGWMFRGCTVLFDLLIEPSDPTANIDESRGLVGKDLEEAKFEHYIASTTFRFAGGNVAKTMQDSYTHIVVHANDTARNKAWLERISQMDLRHGLPRLVTVEWINQSWELKARLDEQRFFPA